MECSIFGLPFMTVAVVTVVPVVVAALLVWWGVSYRSQENSGKRAGEGGKS